MSAHAPIAITPFIKQGSPTGSRWICNPPPPNADEDWIILVADRSDFQAHAQSLDWHLLGENTYEGDIDIWESNTEDIQLIVTDDPLFYDSWVKATSLAKQLNLLKKEDRIRLFQAIVYHNYEAKV